ncbi:MAG TPA: heterodisulfide reductase-related iron-sulfur binding cluster [Candidatus Binataceae bacterium]|nr:heterodisulfide reductase-related iron-sulfur binding cluster [Candidatus Binataceae bacterium]
MATTMKPETTASVAPAIAAATPARALRQVVDYELLFDCVHCGLCLEACPTYVITRAEVDSPRGRIYLMKSLADGSLTLDADAVRHLDLCLECRGCETACPSGVHYGKLIEQSRVYVERNYRRGLAERLRNRVINAIFPYPARMRVLLAPVRLAERAGLRPLMRRVAPAAMRDWLDLIPPRAPRAPAPHSSGDAATVTADAPTAVVHHGCVAQVLTDAENWNTERALAAAGYRVAHLARTQCCGALDLHNGNLERAREFARANVREFEQSGAGAIVSAASGCAAVFAGYGDLLKDDSELGAAAARVAACVSDLSSLMVARGHRFTREFRATVTYHDSCHLAHGLGVRDAPRAILRAIPGVNLIEMAESDLCCGSAGSYNLTEPAMARALVARKADHIAATGADYVVLGNPGCELQIAAELRRRGARTRVIHLADFLALAAGADASRTDGTASAG